MVMKKLVTFLVLSLFLISIVGAESGSSGSDIERPGSSDNSGSGSTDDFGSADSISGDNRSGEFEVKSETRMKEESADGTRIEKRMETESDSDEQRTKVVEKIRTAGLDVEKRVDIRVKQREHLEALLEKCKETKDPEDCEEDMKERLENVAKLEEKDAERLEKLREKREMVAEKLEELKEREHFMKFKLENSKARKVMKEKMESAEKRFKEAREEFDSSQEKQKEVRESFVDARKQWKEECADEAESEKCKELDAQLKKHATNYLTHTLDSIVHELEKVKSRIEGSDTLSEDEAARMLANVEANLAKAAALKAKVEALTETSTKAEVQALTDEIKALWSTVKHELKEHAGRVVNSRMGGILVQSEQMSVKLAKVLERMAEQGADTSTVEALVNQFNAHLDASKAAYEKAQMLFKEAAALKGEAKGKKVKEAQDSMKTAQESLREAHKVLQDIHKALKEQKQLETLEDVEEEDADKDDEADEEYEEGSDETEGKEE